MATATDSIALLKAEVEREEALLARDTKQLQEMEKNAKRAETERKRQMKNVRPVDDPKIKQIRAERLIHSSLQEHTVLRHLDNLPKTQDHPAEFTLADLKDVETSFSEVMNPSHMRELWSMEMLTLPNSSRQTQRYRGWSNS